MNETSVVESAVELSNAVANAATELSPWHLFLQADIIVKAVMLILVLASVFTWAIIFDKAIRLRRVSREAEEFERAFWSGGSLDELYDRMGDHAGHPMALIFVAAMKEWRRFVSRGGQAVDPGRLEGLQRRVAHAMEVTTTRELEGLEKYVGFLATVGSTAPFVGLFGTVWGIMNSFASIAQSKDTSLAVVAPGIAEALFATAIGLIAAIPAVVAYNKLSSDFDRFSMRLEGFSTEFGALLSRQLEERAA
ncbi:MAG: protein TolQ [Alphaproteobacteria bacterium]|nr:protein TolQ [Alphaproteobacteria bacterium]